MVFDIYIYRESERERERKRERDIEIGEESLGERGGIKGGWETEESK